jgi:hypothetical protein
MFAAAINKHTGSEQNKRVHIHMGTRTPHQEELRLSIELLRTSMISYLQAFNFSFHFFIHSDRGCG